MRKRLGILLCFTLVLLPAHSLLAGDAGQETPFSFGAGAGPLGMGGGFTALADDATSVYYNPAGLSFLEYQEVAFMQSVLFEGTAYSFGSWVYPVSPISGLGIGYMRIGTGDIVRRENYTDQGEFDFSHSQFILSYGVSFLRPVGIGGNLKIIHQSLGNLSDFGWGLDLGVRAGVYKGLTIGVIARNLVPADLELETTTEETPWSVVGGISVDALSLSDKASIIASIDLEKFENRSANVLVGSELHVHNTLALRVGYHRDNLTFGVGLRHGRVNVDYGYKLHEYIDPTHHFSLSFLLGRPASEKHGPPPIPVIPVRPLSEEERLLITLKGKADDFFRHFQLDSALTYYRQYEAIDATDHEVLSTISAIEEALRIRLEKEGRLRHAERGLQQYLRNFYARAELFYARKNYSAALDFLELIFDVQGDHYEALKLKAEIEESRIAEIRANQDTARAAEESGRLVRAIEAYNRVLELDSENREIVDARQRTLASLDIPQQLNLGISLYQRGSLEDARRRFQEVLRIRPGEAVAEDYLARISRTGSRQEPATAEDLQKDPVVWQYYLNGMRHMRNGEYQKAIGEWEKVLEIYPNNVNTLNNIEQAKLLLETE